MMSPDNLFLGISQGTFKNPCVSYYHKNVFLKIATITLIFTHLYSLINEVKPANPLFTDRQTHTYIIFLYYSVGMCFRSVSVRFIAFLKHSGHQTSAQPTSCPQSWTDKANILL